MQIVPRCSSQDQSLAQSKSIQQILSQQQPTRHYEPQRPQETRLGPEIKRVRTFANYFKQDVYDAEIDFVCSRS